MTHDDTLISKERWNCVNGKWKQNPRGSHLHITGISTVTEHTTGYMIPCREAEKLALRILKST